MGNNDTIIKLLAARISPNLTDKSSSDDSLLHWAASFSNTEAARVLVLGGAAINTQNKLGQTTLHLACKNKNASVIKALLALGSDPTICDNKGKDCLEECNLSEEELTALKNSKSSGQLDAQQTAELNSNNNNNNNNNNENENAEYDNTSDNENDEFENPKHPLLVLWPPVQHQTRTDSENLILSSMDTVYVHVASDSIDVYPLLSWSGLMETFDQFGFNLQVP